MDCRRDRLSSRLEPGLGIRVTVRTRARARVASRVRLALRCAGGSDEGSGQRTAGLAVCCSQHALAALGPASLMQARCHGGPSNGCRCCRRFLNELAPNFGIIGAPLLRPEPAMAAEAAELYAANVPPGSTVVGTHIRLTMLPETRVPPLFAHYGVLQST